MFAWPLRPLLIFESLCRSTSKYFQKASSSLLLDLFLSIEKNKCAGQLSCIHFVEVRSANNGCVPALRSVHVRTYLLLLHSSKMATDGGSDGVAVAADRVTLPANLRQGSLQCAPRWSVDHQRRRRSLGSDARDQDQARWLAPQRWS